MCDDGAPGTHDSTCCAPSSGAEPAARPRTAAATRAPSGTIIGRTVRLPGGTFLMGTDDHEGFPADGEGPVRAVRIEPFSIAATAVTNNEFAAFVDATGYVTDAERLGWSFVFGGLLPDDFPDTRGVGAAPWWREVFGARWCAPEGPQSDIVDRGDHPVVHVSWHDAAAYCTWAGATLPTEAEWEYAARGGLEQQRYPWGDELTPDSEHMCNIWQGTFPSHNTLDDGYLGTAPADAFPANGFGLHNAAGNIWEWCEDVFAVPPGTASADEVGNAPRVIRGGSYLCHRSYCNRCRVAARSSNTPSSTTGHMGFRCVG